MANNPHSEERKKTGSRRYYKLKDRSPDEIAEMRRQIANCSKSQPKRPKVDMHESRRRLGLSPAPVV